ncbi:MAG: DNA alkylation repair protein [Cytophagales bacterium]
MTANEILKELESYADEQTKNTLIKHGAKEPFFGVKVQDLKKILKKTKKNHQLSLELYASGNSDAMYLAGLMADENQISREQLEDWVKKAYWYYLSEYTVPWIAAETDFGFELGLDWINSPKENIAAAGWSTLAYYSAVNEDENLDIETYIKLLKRVEKRDTRRSKQSEICHEWFCDFCWNLCHGPYAKVKRSSRSYWQSGGRAGRNGL